MRVGSAAGLAAAVRQRWVARPLWCAVPAALRGRRAPVAPAGYNPARCVSIYTKTGDKGRSSLFTGCVGPRGVPPGALARWHLRAVSGFLACTHAYRLRAPLCRWRRSERPALRRQGASAQGRRRVPGARRHRRADCRHRCGTRVLQPRPRDPYPRRPPHRDPVSCTTCAPCCRGLCDGMLRRLTRRSWSRTDAGCWMLGPTWQHRHRPRAPAVRSWTASCRSPPPCRRACRAAVLVWRQLVWPQQIDVSPDCEQRTAMRSEWVAALETWIDEMDRCVGEKELGGVLKGAGARRWHTLTCLVRSALQLSRPSCF